MIIVVLVSFDINDSVIIVVFDLVVVLELTNQPLYIMFHSAILRCLDPLTRVITSAILATFLSDLTSVIIHDFFKLDLQMVVMFFYLLL